MFCYAGFESTILPLHHSVRHVSPHYLIPCHEEGLREVALVAGELVMDVMVRRVVPEQDVERVPRKHQPAVVVDPLDGGEGEEESGRRLRHP